MKKNVPKSKIVIYQTKNGAIALKGDVVKETIWATQAQIAEIFSVERSVVTKHVRNLFKDKELNERSVCANFAHTADDGKTYQVKTYNLDVILSVGYRTNSERAVEFRKWATTVLRDHITRGYTINPTVIKSHYTEFQEAVENVKHLLPAGTSIDHASVLELISVFANTWFSLDAYDKDRLAAKGVTRKSVMLTAEHLTKALADFKKVLMKKRQAPEFFGSERNVGSVGGIVGNVMQSFGGKPVYPTIEEKAAHLLYFMVKNHPFVDGNKRNGAYAFVWFLNRAGVLDRSTMTSAALTALTLFIAESHTKDKERMIRLVLQLLRK